MQIALITFYLVSGLKFISYFKLICTDITVKESVLAPNHIPSSKCRYCNLSRRSDMYHCRHCGTCCEMIDHHCGVFGVCICAKNFKYFILFIFYGGLSLVAFAWSLYKLRSNCNNKVIKEALTLHYEGYIIGAITVGFFYVIISICLFIGSLPIG